MIESEKRLEEIIKKVNCEISFEQKSLIVDKSPVLCSFTRNFPKSENLKTSAHNKLNEHDMLQANQANLKCSSSYANNFKQVININSTLHERYHKLQKISLHHILTKGNFYQFSGFIVSKFSA